jgi:peptidoglycan-N-acetylglucosamine deacetylase
MGYGMMMGSGGQGTSRDPDSGDGRHPRQARHGAPMPRRVVLAALGGVLITGTAVAVAAKTIGDHPDSTASHLSPAGEGNRPAATGTRTTPAKRHASLAARHEEPRPAASTSTEHPAAPAKPQYYIHDGPMTVALTIDDGPSPLYTPEVLAVLRQYDVHATFSMVGQNVAYYPQVAREVADAGHLIANHTWSHQDLTVLPAAAMRDQVTRAEAEIHAATGQLPTLFRAPYGAWSPALLDYCAAQGLTALDWSVDPQDWARPGVSAIVQNILRTTASGSIILEHDGGGDRSQTVAALKIFLPRLLDEGYKFRLA